MCTLVGGPQVLEDHILFAHTIFLFNKEEDPGGCALVSRIMNCELSQICKGSKIRVRILGGLAKKNHQNHL